ncbi:hypothetical protein N665_2004s0009 [Sinapis alba]|nr:hypothetical protein N665_2004s0009 [Sinapis alba]
MISNEEGKPSQSSAPIQEQSNVHVYHHDWDAMQAYYGPWSCYTSSILQHKWSCSSTSSLYLGLSIGTSLLLFCYSYAIPANDDSLWCAPYPPFSRPGGVYASQMGSQSHGSVSQAIHVVATPLNLEATANSPGNTEQGKGSDGNTTGGEQSRRKRSREESPSNDDEPAAAMGTPVMPTSIDFPQTCHGAPHDVWNEKEVKREKRKQSNRESARRSRLRKQVDALVGENTTLRSKLSQLNNESEKLRLENEALLVTVYSSHHTF